MYSWFFPKRLGRIGWLGRMILFVAPAITLIVLTGRQGSLRPHLGDTLAEIIGLAASAFAGLYGLFFVHLPRCRSVGLPGVALIVLFFPPFNVVLLMMFLFASEGYWLRMRHRQRAVAESNSHDPSA